MENVWRAGVAALVLFPSIVLAETPTFVSEYSSLAEKDCKMTVTATEGGLQKCPSHGGYDVMIAGGEGTSGVVLKSKGKEHSVDAEEAEAPKPLQWERPYVVGGSLEWRYQLIGSKKTLVGLIYRVGDQGWPEKQSLLLAIRVTENSFCPLGAAKGNEEARQLVDSGKACPEKKTPIPAGH